MQNLQLLLASTPFIRQDPEIVSGPIVFTNDGKDDITAAPQTNPLITMRIIMCDDTQASDIQELLTDLWEYEDDIPYIEEHFIEIFAGIDPTWIISDVQIDEINMIHLGLTAKQQKDENGQPAVLTLHLSSGTYSFVALFQCQDRSLLVQQFDGENCTTITYLMENNRLTRVARSSDGGWEISDLS